MNQLIETAKTLAQYNPAFFSVTFGAGGSTRQRTIETVIALQQKVGISITPHIACIGYDKNELANILNQYQAMGINRIVALRGDLPSGMVSYGDFTLAHEFIKFIRVLSGDHFQIEVAAYPECHPQAKDAIYDVTNLKMKFDAGANSAITQYFFNSDAYFYFMDECARQQIDIPIFPGIMPIMEFSKLKRFSDICGAEIPRWLYKRLEAYSDDAESIKEFGAEMMSRMCERLLKGGAPGLHFYTLNQDICTRILHPIDMFWLTSEKNNISLVSKVG